MLSGICPRIRPWTWVKGIRVSSWRIARHRSLSPVGTYYIGGVAVRRQPLLVGGHTLRLGSKICSCHKLLLTKSVTYPPS